MMMRSTVTMTVSRNRKPKISLNVFMTKTPTHRGTSILHIFR